MIKNTLCWLYFRKNGEKKLTLETKSGKNYFEIEEYGGKFSLSRVTYSLSFFGSTKYERLVDAKSLEDAIVLAR